MPRKIIYLINPISGTRGKTALQSLIAKKTDEQGIGYQILPTRADGDYAWLLPLIDQEGITDIVVCGGDGTVNAVAAALRGTGTRIGIVPMGSGNGLAFTAGIPKKAEAALDIIFKGHASLVDGFTINGRFSCMLCGIGLDGKVAHEFATQSRRGLRTYVRVTASNYFKASPYRFGLKFGARVEGGVGAGACAFDVDAYFIDISNANQFGNHVTIAPRAKLDDGLLDIVVARKTGKTRLVMAVFAQIMGWNRLGQAAEIGGEGNGTPIKDGRAAAGLERDGRAVWYFQTPALTIENPQEAPLHIDGEPAQTSREFVIRVEPGAINLIRPATP